MTRKLVIMAACFAMTASPLTPLSATASTEQAASVVQQQWVPATRAEQQDARGGAFKDLPPKVKRAIIKKVRCKKKGVGC
jgi:hypothetical protein